MSVKNIEVTFLTPGLAQEWLTNYPYLGQRKMQPHHVHFLASEMTNERFKDSVAEFVYCAETDQTYLISAYHRSEAVIKSGIGIPVVVVTWEYDTLKELEEKCGVTDVVRGRGQQEQISVLTKHIDLPDDFKSKVVTALNYHEANFRPAVGNLRYEQRSPIRKVSRLEEWKAEATLLNECISGRGDRATRTYLTRQSVLSVLLVCAQAKPDLTKNFLFEILEGDTPVTNSPVQWMLRLKGMYLNGPVVSRVVAQLWNAYVDGVTLTELPNGHDRMTRIAGSCING